MLTPGRNAANIVRSTSTNNFATDSPASPAPILPARAVSAAAHS
jgi:hypothetical protein